MFRSSLGVHEQNVLNIYERSDCVYTELIYLLPLVICKIALFFTGCNIISSTETIHH